MQKTHPSWALKHRKPGTELRFINGHYYLYEVSSKWNNETKRSQKITGKIIGKIRPDGELVPSKRREAKKVVLGFSENPSIYIKEYGLSYFMLYHMKDEVNRLKQYFPHWQYIVSVAYCRLFKQLPINRMPLHLQHSYLSEEFNDVRFIEKNISIALRDVGRNRGQVVEYMKWNVTSRGACIG